MPDLDDLEERAAGTYIEVTPKMASAGKRVWENEAGDTFADFPLIEESLAEVYRAMVRAA